MIAANPQKDIVADLRQALFYANYLILLVNFNFSLIISKKRKKKGPVNLKFSKKKRLNGDHVKTEK